MKVLFVGLGSIGTRHLKNLYTVAKEEGIELEVDALRSSNRLLPEDTQLLVRHQYSSLLQITNEYDLLFITNPTNLHYSAIKALSQKAKTLFIEKPLFEDDTYSLAGCGLVRKAAYVACPMRWCGTFLKLKEVLAGQKVYSARVICSSYLPEWRPDADYRKVYSARKEMGGGVSIDLIHEWDYLIDLFGEPSETFNFQGTYSDLEIDSDDLSVYIARYPDMLAEVHLDYFGRTYRRTAEFFVQTGTITADFGAGTLTLADGQVLDCEEEVNERYLREMRYFLRLHKGEETNINPPALALHALTIALGKQVAR